MNLSDLPMLIGPRHKQRVAERDNRERLGRAKMRRAKGAKNHSTNKERSFADSQKAARALAKRERHDRKRAEYAEQVAAYWAGLRDEHP